MRLFSVIVMVLWTGSALARTIPEQAFSGALRWSKCHAEPSKQADGSEVPEATPTTTLCLRSKLGTQVLLRDDTSKENKSLYYAHLYHGLHLTRHIAIHGDYEALRLTDIGPKTDGERLFEDDARTKELFLQLGNPADDRYRFSVGKIRPVFGINFSPLPEIFDATLRSNRYWRAPNFGARLTFDTLVSSVFDVSVHGNALRHKDKHMDLEEDKPAEASLAARMMFDIAALDGFRFVASGYGTRDGQRRVGGGFVNMSARGDFTTFEWVRLANSTNLTTSDFQQNFRVNFTSAFRADMRWIFDFESERKGYRMGTLGFDAKLPDYGLFRLTGSVHNGWERKADHYLMLTTAFQVAI